jgi:hypothetical protein
VPNPLSGLTDMERPVCTAGCVVPIRKLDAKCRSDVDILATWVPNYLLLPFPLPELSPPSLLPLPLPQRL